MLLNYRSPHPSLTGRKLLLSSFPWYEYNPPENAATVGTKPVGPPEASGVAPGVAVKAASGLKSGLLYGDAPVDIAVVDVELMVAFVNVPAPAAVPPVPFL